METHLRPRAGQASDGKTQWWVAWINCDQMEMKLLNPTWEELDGAFLKCVAKGKLTAHDEWTRDALTLDVGDGMGNPNKALYIPPYSHSMTHLLPWLEKSGMYVSIRHWDGEDPGWMVSLWENDENGPERGRYLDKSLARACTIALLRANNVEVEFTDL